MSIRGRVVGTLLLACIASADTTTRSSKNDDTTIILLKKDAFHFVFQPKGKDAINRLALLSDTNPDAEDALWDIYKNHWGGNEVARALAEHGHGERKAAAQEYLNAEEARYKALIEDQQRKDRAADRRVYFDAAIDLAIATLLVALSVRLFGRSAKSAERNLIGRIFFSGGLALFLTPGMAGFVPAPIILAALFNFVIVSPQAGILYAVGSTEMFSCVWLAIFLFLEYRARRNRVQA